MRSQGFRRGIAHRKDIDHKVFEEFRTGLFLVDGPEGFASPDDVVEMEPAGNQVSAGVEDESSHEARLAPDEKRGAFRSERELALSILCEELQSDQYVGNGGDAALRCAGGRHEFLCCFWAGVELIENVVADGGFDDEWRGVGPGELHDAFRRYLR